MGQLIKITTKPFESVRISQSGKFVSADQVDVERRKAIRRSQAKANQAHANTNTVVNRVDQAYSNANRSVKMDAALQEMTNKAPVVSNDKATSQPKQVAAPAAQIPVNVPNTAVQQPQGEGAAEIVETGVEMAEYSAAESNANYYQERGSLEMRVQRGDVSFVPPLDMTIVTQKPEIKIEYTGDFNYFPNPESAGSNVNIET